MQLTIPGADEDAFVWMYLYDSVTLGLDIIIAKTLRLVFAKLFPFRCNRIGGIQKTTDTCHTVGSHGLVIILGLLLH